MLGRIYYLWSPGREEVYVGSSERSLEDILIRHRNHFRSWLNDRGPFYSSFYLFYQTLAEHDVYIELLYEGAFENVKQLRQMERFYIEELPTLNECIPISTYQEKRNKFNAGRRLKVPCPKCGKVYSKQVLSTHLKKHPS
jgi:hypothetical protein